MSDSETHTWLLHHVIRGRKSGQQSEEDRCERYQQVTGSSGWRAAWEKIEELEVLSWNHRESGDAVKRNQEFKRRHFQGQMLRSALDMPSGGYQRTHGWSYPLGSWIQDRTPGQSSSKETDLLISRWWFEDVSMDEKKLPNGRIWM